ncbi:hypothetical protein E5676_scaffold394G00120 [Cucumis melo var. makuwa]|uniref:Uncharacterized protein n=1 Tax=Cucumis melo var. makuwa TaxID=1194695 RepID=A0A5D3DUD8_CUCMM|nr:hypothetical protein E5676_scaffold394G00120 [Cucumis melo var. makuwa]
MLHRSVGGIDQLEGLPHEATWEVCDDFKQPFPDFHLEDKVDLEEECNDRLPIILQCNRRGKKGKARVRESLGSENGDHSGARVS